MKVARLLLILTCLSLVSASLIAQFSPRKDYVWARDVAGATMTVDGVLNEAVWAKAESVSIHYGVKDGQVGSGWYNEQVAESTDPANAVVKFLVDKSTNKLYIAVIAKDSSVGGGGGWEHGDGILAGMFSRKQLALPQGTSLDKDIFITWMDSGRVGALPNLLGGELPSRGIAVAAVTVQGLANSDTDAVGARVADQGWTLEMSVALDSLGYNANASQTDAIEMHVNIWDADWLHSPDANASLAWWSNRWGNNGGGAGRVLVRNDVNVNTTQLPAYDPDWTVPNGSNYPSVKMDGTLNDGIWQFVPNLDLQWGNVDLQSTYSLAGRHGQFAIKYNSTNGVIDAGRCRIKMFFVADTLFIGADVDDQSVNGSGGGDYFDGLVVNMQAPADTLRDKNEHTMGGKRFGVAIDSVVKAVFDAVKDSTGAPVTGLRIAGKLKPGSTINNNTDVDAGYTLEMAIDLTKFGYPSGQLNKTVALGYSYFDYDKTPTDTSAYHVWWFREYPNVATAAFVQLSNSTLVTGVVGRGTNGPDQFTLYNNYPNPFNPSTTIRFTLPEQGSVRIQVYDLLGRLVTAENLTNQTSGLHEFVFDALRLSSGVYYYNLEFSPTRSGGKRLSDTHKMLFLK